MGILLKKYFVIKQVFIFLHSLKDGEMAEWSNAVVLKTIVQQCTGGSNPSLSAKHLELNLGVFL